MSLSDCVEFFPQLNYDLRPYLIVESSPGELRLTSLFDCWIFSRWTTICVLIWLLNLPQVNYDLRPYLIVESSPGELRFTSLFDCWIFPMWTTIYVLIWLLNLPQVNYDICSYLIVESSPGELRFTSLFDCWIFPRWTTREILKQPWSSFHPMRKLSHVTGAANLSSTIDLSRSSGTKIRRR